MSNNERRANLPAILKTAEPTFTELARMHGVADFTFAREAGFAISLLNDSEYLAQVACGNPESLKEAIINVAAIGLSLSPAYNFAYLVPRKVKDKFKVCLDISYKGFIEIATANGVIVWAKAELVRQSDKFEYRGINEAPLHVFNPFVDRGGIVGGYVLAKMTSGDLLVDCMSIHEIYQIRDRSEAWKAYQDKKIKSTPWFSHEGEMIKKTLIRRGRKSWPSSVSRALDRAINATRDEDSIDFQAEGLLAAPTQPDRPREEEVALIREYLGALDRKEDAFIEHLCKMTNRSIKKLEDLTSLELTQAITFLEGVVADQDARREKLKAKVGSNEIIG